MKHKSLYNRVAALLLVFTLLVSTFPASATYAIPDSDVPIVLGENTSVSVEDDGVSGGTDAGSDVGDNKSTEDPTTTDDTSGDAQTSSEGSGAEESTPTEPGTEPNTDGNKTGDSSVSEGKEGDTSESGKTDPSQEDSKESKDPESSKNDAEPASDDNSGSTEEDDLPYGDTGFESVLGSDFDSSTGDNGGFSLFAARAATSGTLYTDGTEFSYNQSWRSEFGPYTSYRLKYFNGQPAYCLQAHLGTATSAGYTGTSDLSSYSYYQRNRLKLAVAYGYGGVNDSTLVSLANGWPQYAMLATQEVIWEITEGYSNLSDLFIGPGGKYDSSLAVPVQNCYNYIKQRMASQYTIPSFAVSRPTQTYNDIELKYNGTNYSATVYDSNRVLPNFNSFTFSQSGVSTSRSGYNMTITATADAVKSLTNGVSSRASAGNAIDPDDISAWLLSPSSSANLQKCIALNGWPDPVYAYVRVKVTKTTGDLAIVKTSEDGKVSNVSFTITGPNNYSITVTTDSNGKISVSDLQPGTYTITENTPDNYVPTSSQTVTLSIGDIKTVRFKNVLKKGAVKITKTAEDGLVEGITFKLTGTSAAGTNVSLTATTDSTGVALIQNVPIGSNYTLEELNTAAKYVVPAIQDGVTVSYGVTTEAEFENKLARGAVEVTKTSEDGLVEGIKFRLTGTSTSGESVNMTAITNDKGVATFKDVLIGSNYTVEEVDTANRYVMPPIQEGVTIKVQETAKLSFHNKLARGAVEVTKTSEDGDVEGIKFRLTGTAINGEKVNMTATTNDKGVATFEDVLIGNDYSVVEVDTAEKYIVPEVVDGVKVKLNETTKVNMKNVLKRGSLEVTKTSEDGLVEGITFRLTGTSISGAAVDLTAVTNDKGIATFENVLIGENYKLEEVDTDIKYVIPAVQSDLAVTYNTTTKTTVENILKKWKVTVVKTDSETGSVPRGDGVFEGAVYGLYKDGELVKKYTIGENGKFTTDEYICGAGYTIQEIQAPVGYLIDPTVYPVGSEAKEYRVEHNTAPEISSVEQIKRGTFSITKLVKGVNGSDPVFEEGAEFQYWLQSAGSYENAKEDERGTLISNADGQTGKTISLPYGTYVVRQTKAATGVKLASDFTVLVGETDGEDKPLIVHNEPVTAYLRVVKVDADDGEVIPWGGAKFEIYDPDGNKVTQKVTYPKAETISVFETNDEGYFITPLVLPYGEHYRLVEIEAPKGYKLMDAPLIFDVTPETIKVDPENNIEYVEVIAGDKAVQPTVDSMATGVNDSKELLPLKETTITDKVDCTDVIPGKTYTVKGHLRLYSTGEPLLDKNGERITASKTFKADKDFSGHVEMTFTLDASNLAGEKIVVFQELYRGENLVASHSDIEDADQTVSVVAPEIKTFAKNGAEGTKESKIVYSDSKASIVDAVSYKGLIPGLEYTLLCNLMDVEAGEIFKDADDKEVTATVTFTPEAAEGAVDVTCELNASKAAGKKLVAFETLSYDGEEIASHKDIEDEDQTVEIKTRPHYFHEEPKDNPITGDTGIGPWAVLFAAAVFVTSGFLMFSYRRRKKDTLQ